MYCGNMGRWISWWSRVNRRKEVVVFQDRRITYGELNENINRIANALTHRLGVKGGDRIGCLLNNSISYYEIAFACAKIGAPLVPVNVRLNEREIAYIVEDCDPKVLFTEDLFLPAVEAVLSHGSGLHLINLDGPDYQDLLGEASPEEPADQVVNPQKDVHVNRLPLCDCQNSGDTDGQSSPAMRRAVPMRPMSRLAWTYM